MKPFPLRLPWVLLLLLAAGCASMDVLSDPGFKILEVSPVRTTAADAQYAIRLEITNANPLSLNAMLRYQVLAGDVKLAPPQSLTLPVIPAYSQRVVSVPLSLDSAQLQALALDRGQLPVIFQATLSPRSSWLRHRIDYDCAASLAVRRMPQIILKNFASDASKKQTVLTFAIENPNPEALALVGISGTALADGRKADLGLPAPRVELPARQTTELAVPARWRGRTAAGGPSVAAEFQIAGSAGVMVVVVRR